jgi:hypothetical protein
MQNLRQASDNFARACTGLLPILEKLARQMQAVYDLLEAEAKIRDMTVEEYIQYIGAISKIRRRVEYLNGEMIFQCALLGLRLRETPRPRIASRGAQGEKPGIVSLSSRSR